MSCTSKTQTVSELKALEYYSKQSYSVRIDGTLPSLLAVSALPFNDYNEIH